MEMGGLTFFCIFLCSGNQSLDVALQLPCNCSSTMLQMVSVQVKELAEKAQTGKLTPNEFQGGTFSISNLGMFQVDQFCAIINPPQGGILAVGRGSQVVEPVIGEDGIEKPAVFTKMNLTLSADHRFLMDKLEKEKYKAANQRAKQMLDKSNKEAI